MRKLPQGYEIKTRLSQRTYGYNMAYLYDPTGRLIAEEMIHTLTSGQRAASRAFRNLGSIARADAKWGAR